MNAWNPPIVTAPRLPRPEALKGWHVVTAYAIASVAIVALIAGDWLFASL